MGIPCGKGMFENSIKPYSTLKILIFSKIIYQYNYIDISMSSVIYKLTRKISDVHYLIRGIEFFEYAIEKMKKKISKNIKIIKEEFDKENTLKYTPDELKLKYTPDELEKINDIERFLRRHIK
jgi:hypothetical protein